MTSVFSEISQAHDVASSVARRALVVDDSASQRILLVKKLQDWGYETHQARCGHEALDLCAQGYFDLILSDWMMPGMNGLDFCRAFRDRVADRYSYFILLTARNDPDAVVEGLTVGADDFLYKPISPVELRARIAAGERLLAMERAVKASNAELRDALGQLQAVHAAIERDLQEARKLQQSLLPVRDRRFGTCHVAFLLESSGHVGGDLVGALQIAPDRIGVYSIDVSGHGVTAAILCARIAALFSDGPQGLNIVMARDAKGGAHHILSPAQVAARLNTILLKEMLTDNYLTMAYMDIDLRTGELKLVQAGHPHPILQRADGEAVLLGQGGFPVGLLPDAEYQDVTLRLNPGERILLYSDGIIEAQDGKGREFGQMRLARLIQQARDVTGSGFLDLLRSNVIGWSARREFVDDVSGVMVEMTDLLDQPPRGRRKRYFSELSKH